MKHDGWARLDDKDRGWYSFGYVGWSAIVPLCDLEIHDTDNPDCRCKPFWDPRTCILMHHAFDGRDLVERVEQGLSII